MKKPTVTIAASVYNEEKNILNFLKSLLAQKENGFVLEQILLVLDGCTDKTHKKLLGIDYPKLRLIVHKQRAGKSSRLNEIYNCVNSDIIVQTDADVVFSHSRVVADIIRPIITNDKVAMCGGDAYPVGGDSFVGKADAITFKTISDILRNAGTGHNVFSVDGRILAYKREFYKTMTVPYDMIANDHYSYLFCRSKKLTYQYVPSATVFFQAPQTITDKVRQNIRSSAIPLRMRRYFDVNLIQKEYAIAPRLKVRSIITQLFNSPVSAIVIYLVNCYCIFRAKEMEAKLNAKWPIAYSTKNITT